MFAESMDNAIYSVSHLIDQRPKQKDYIVHSHNYSEILLFLSGEADYFVDGMKYSLKPYDLILIPRHTRHCLLLKSTTPYENYVIHFYDSKLFLKEKERLFRAPNIFNIEADRQLLDYFRRFDAMYEAYDKEDFHCCAQCLCQEIATYCCYMERIPAVSHSTVNVLIPNVLQYIDSHLQDELKADLLAMHFNISRSHLQNVFSREIGIGLKQYIMKRKILAAHNDMLEGLSASKAAAKYGFQEYSTFYRLYKKTFEASPSKKNKIFPDL